MYVYILRCADDTLYTGIAADIGKRLKQHRGEIKGGAKYTHAHGVKKFEAVWETDDSTAARKMECALKKLKRSEKESLIREPFLITEKYVPELSEYNYICAEGKMNNPEKSSPETVSLSREQVINIYNKYMTEDFPEDELKPLSMILKSLDDGIYTCIGLEFDGEIIGYAYFVCLGSYTLLDYFAVVPDKRGQGYGSVFLNKLSDFFSSYDMILVESEDPDFAVSEEDRITRLRRLRFYTGNGFRDTGARALLFGVNYILLEPENSASHSRVEICSAYLGHYRAVLPEKMFIKNVSVK